MADDNNESAPSDVSEQELNAPEQPAVTADTDVATEDTGIAASDAVDAGATDTAAAQAVSESDAEATGEP
ncbi:MAG TPA: hypothetical protein DHW40_02085, partial [Microbacterium sp.]|nr:hypothetical protein [Microbacterium sp.]